MPTCPENLAGWRKSLRAELIAARLALNPEVRAKAYAAVVSHLDATADAFRGLVVGFCWPFRGEPDLRELMQSFIASGASGAMPALQEKNTPMRFRHWWPGMRMAIGAWDIPIPAESDEVVPDAILIPMVGYDQAGYRLGYGGGYFDRMLAGIEPPPITIGVALAQSRMETIYPQPYDVPMDCVVTDDGMSIVVDGELARVARDAAIGHLTLLERDRRLPRPRQAALTPSGIELSSPVCYAGEFPGYFGETMDVKKK